MVTAAPILRKFFYAPERALSRLARRVDRGFERLFGNINDVRGAVTSQGMVMRPPVNPPVKPVNVRALLSAADETAVAMGSNGTPSAPPTSPAQPERPVSREQAQKALDRMLRRPSLSSRITTVAKVGLGLVGAYSFIELGTALGSKFLALGASLGSIYLLGAVLSAAPFILFSIGAKLYSHFTFPLRKELKDPNSRAAYAVAQLAIEQGVINHKRINLDDRTVARVLGDIAAINIICAKYGPQDVRPPAETVLEGKEDLLALRDIVGGAGVETEAITKANAQILELEKKIPQVEATLPKPAGGAPADGTAAADETPPAPRQTIKVGDREYYDPVLIGQGLSAKVYKVTDADGNIFALKVFDPNVESITRPHARKRIGKERAIKKDIDNLRKRFVEREIAAIRALNKAGAPHVVTLHYAVTEGLQPAMVLSFGHQSLRELLTKNLTGLKQDLAVEIIKQVCVALQEALTKEDSSGIPLQIIHRDLKPTNIMVNDFEATGGDVEVMLVDFGAAKPLNMETQLARESASVHTTLGTVYSTPGYIAPIVVEKQGSGELTDASADMFAVGVIFHELLRGKSPFEGKISVEDQLTEQGAQKTRQLIPTLPIEGLATELVTIIRELLEGKHSDYQPIIDQLEAYAQVLEGGKTEAGTPPAAGSQQPSTFAGRPQASQSTEGPAILIPDEGATPPTRAPRPIVLDDKRQLSRLLSGTAENVARCLDEIIDMDMAKHMAFTPAEVPALQELLAQTKMRHPELAYKITDATNMLNELLDESK